MFEHTESWVLDSVSWLRLIIEGMGAVVIAAGMVGAIWGFLRLLAARDSSGFTQVRLRFARYLVLGLEFQLAADILSTAVSPSWEQIGKLAAIAVIRTGLNFFLIREMREERDAPAGDVLDAPPAPPAPSASTAPSAPGR